MRGHTRIILAIIVLSLMAAACNAPVQPADTPPAQPGSEVAQPGETGEDEGPDGGEKGARQQKGIDYQTVKPNEAGKIMVLMYHVIGDSEGEWSRRWDNFRKDLGVLYEKGYRLISLNDYISNNIDVEAGYTPVVLTFDDGTQGQFNVLEEDGKLVVDPKCAVGILEDFHSEKPDFGLAATFFVYYPMPFRQKDFIEYKFKYLVEKGMDIGNHTYGHANLGQLDAEGIQSQLGRMVAETDKYLPGYTVNTLALPYGVNAKEQYRQYVYKGEYRDFAYQNNVVLLVGSNPAPSPVDVKFNPLSTPRIRATDDPSITSDMYDWMDYFDKNPHERYVSDGDPNRVVIPREMEGKVDENKVGDKELIVYDLE
ncbi:MAG: polysaccharide deacetylase family protein [Clostridia bacterium]|jgi:peptidoglycan/xylan/chitin deacetylase (PgdA/CDA1 family)|nr:polysaccharide deacetylase family protein [Clostridiales bacterium]